MELTLAIFHRTSRRTRSTTSYCNVACRPYKLRTDATICVNNFGWYQEASLQASLACPYTLLDDAATIKAFIWWTLPKGRLHHYRGELGVGRALRYGDVQLDSVIV